jgi:hypothetical protein
MHNHASSGDYASKARRVSRTVDCSNQAEELIAQPAVEASLPSLMPANAKDVVRKYAGEAPPTDQRSASPKSDTATNSTSPELPADACKSFGGIGDEGDPKGTSAAAQRESQLRAAGGQ